MHRVLLFRRSHCLGKYVDYNTKKRTKANKDFEKDFYKLMNHIRNYKHEIFSETVRKKALKAFVDK